MREPDRSEKNFEVEHVLKALVEGNGYIERSPDEDFAKSRYIDPSILLEFVKDTQPAEWKKQSVNYGEEAGNKFLDRVEGEIEKRGTLSVLRDGIKDRGARFDIAYFKPVSGLNPEHRKLYERNVFSVIRQLPYSRENNNTLDVALFINGIPIITAELKNHLTGQNYQNAITQYKVTRNPNEPLLKRCLVHFAVDNDTVYFTAELKGSGTRFLPFNKDIVNPEDERGFKSSYLYHDIWSPDSLLEIMGNFMHFQQENELIFPRYHQLDTVRNVVESVWEKGAGKNYLIQHSAGSGKTLTISWISQHLAQMHNNNQERIFDGIIIISDRRVIDRQLREAVKQLISRRGVVVWAETSKHLREALEQNRDIIVTTQQKFPFVVKELSGLEGQRFAVLIDEAHSSQSGATARAINKTLSYGSLDEAEQAEEGEDEVTFEDEIARDIRASKRMENVSFFAFTATPKAATLEMFGEKQADGSFRPFSLYSMKQAIKEGFILDVLQNFISYKSYFKLLKKIEEDPEFEKRKATALLHRHVSLHEFPIKKKTEIILDHFFKYSIDKIGGKARVMLITASRLHAVRYKLEFDKQLKELQSNVKPLVAFTGIVKDGGVEFTESKMNGFFDTQTRDKLQEDPYRILIVASKYQTGFDEPLLHTMYVDRKLRGVHAVQSLSRLNRRRDGKDSVAILDFVNEPEDIQKAFTPYYDDIVLATETDPNQLYALENKLKDTGVIDFEDVEAFARVWYRAGDQALLLKNLAPAVSRYSEEQEKEKRKHFRNILRDYVKLYGFISQIAKFEDVELDKLYHYGRFLLKVLPVDKETLPREILESVDIDSYRVQKRSEGPRPLGEGTDEVQPKAYDGKGGIKPDIKDLLSEIIQEINRTSGAEILSSEDKVKAQHLLESIEKNEEFVESRKTNTKTNMKELFKELFKKEMEDMYDKDLKFYEKLEKNVQARDALREGIFNLIFKEA